MQSVLLFDNNYDLLLINGICLLLGGYVGIVENTLFFFLTETSIIIHRSGTTDHNATDCDWLSTYM